MSSHSVTRKHKHKQKLSLKQEANIFYNLRVDSNDSLAWIPFRKNKRRRHTEDKKKQKIPSSFERSSLKGEAGVHAPISTCQTFQRKCRGVLKSRLIICEQEVKFSTEKKPNYQHL